MTSLRTSRWNHTKIRGILRYLKRAVAWHAALDTLCSNKTLPEFLKNIVIGVVEIPSFLCSVMTLPETSDEFFVWFLHMMERRDHVVKALADHSSDTFSPGAVSMLKAN